MKLSYNRNNPYTFYVNNKQVFKLPEEEQNQIVEEFLTDYNLVVNHFNDFLKISTSSYSNMAELNPEVINLWKQNLIIKNPKLKKEINKLSNFWNNSRHLELRLYKDDDQIYLHKHRYKEYLLYDIYSYPGDNQFGTIFIKIDSDFIPVFSNSDGNLTVIENDNLVVKELQTILKAFQEYRQYDSLKQFTDLDEIDHKLGLTTLIDCCGFNLIKPVKFLVSQGADININIDGEYALLHALLNVSIDEDCEIFNLLMSKGADVNLFDEEDNNLLLTALKEIKNNDVIKIILPLTENINHQNHWGQTALMLSYDNLEIMELIVEKGADLNIKDEKGCTALMWCRENECEDTEEYLISIGANPDIKNNDGLSFYDL